MKRDRTDADVSPYSVFPEELMRYIGERGGWKELGSTCRDLYKLFADLRHQKRKQIRDKYYKIMAEGLRPGTKEGLMDHFRGNSTGGMEWISIHVPSRTVMSYAVSIMQKVLTIMGRRGTEPPIPSGVKDTGTIMTTPTSTDYMIYVQVFGADMPFEQLCKWRYELKSKDPPAYMLDYAIRMRWYPFIPCDSKWLRHVEIRLTRRLDDCIREEVHFTSKEIRAKWSAIRNKSRPFHMENGCLPLQLVMQTIPKLSPRFTDWLFRKQALIEQTTFTLNACVKLDEKDPAQMEAYMAEVTACGDYTCQTLLPTIIEHPSTSSPPRRVNPPRHHLPILHRKPKTLLEAFRSLGHGWHRLHSIRKVYPEADKESLQRLVDIGMVYCNSIPSVKRPKKTTRTTRSTPTVYKLRYMGGAAQRCSPVNTIGPVVMSSRYRSLGYLPTGRSGCRIRF